MRHIILSALVTVLFFTACNNSEKGNGTNAKDSATPVTTDTTVSGVTTPPASGNPGSGSGNNASGTSNAGVNGTDTAAIGTNHSIGKDTAAAHKRK